MKATVTAFTPAHYDAAYALWETCEGIGLSSADSRENIIAYLERNAGMSFVAIDGEDVVGAILGGHDGRRGYLHHLAVKAKYRRQGLGQKLVKHALHALRSAGMTRCHIFVFPDNLEAKAFSNNSGWHLRSEVEVMTHFGGDAPSPC